MPTFVREAHHPIPARRKVARCAVSVENLERVVGTVSGRRRFQEGISRGARAVQPDEVNPVQRRSLMDHPLDLKSRRHSSALGGRHEAANERP
jgi:hypothetical protein